MTTSEQEARLQEELLEDARKKADRILKRAKRDADKVLATVRKEQETAREERLADAENEALARSRSILAGIENEKSRLWLTAREGVLDQFFADVLRDLETASVSEQALYNLAEEAVLRLGPGELRIAVREEDRAILSDGGLEKLSAAVQQQFGEPATIAFADEPLQSIGVVVWSADGTRTFDNTCSTRLERLKNRFRAAAAGDFVAEMDTSQERTQDG